MPKPKLIILTPVRDEAWILERFLLAVSEVADHIIVLDQRSQDASRAICARFPNVLVVDNPNPEYNEIDRSRLMLQVARGRFGANNLLIALDADEILTGDSLVSAEWETLRSLSSGTVVTFEKPELLPNPPRCVRYQEYFKLGLIDDGAELDGRLIHSQRVPFSSSAPLYRCEAIKIMHFARLRTTEYEARQAFYCMVENVNRSKSHRIRNSYYSPSRFRRFGEGISDPCPPEWFRWWQDRGIDLWSYTSNRYNAFHLRALQLFAKHGSARFRWDDIWWEDWEEARQHFLRSGAPDLPTKAIRRPAGWMRAATALALRLYGVGSALSALGKRSPRGIRTAVKGAA